jgi:creatinine amidohydrolase/Fe(II)-dependent formamide hydrolase-like protein
LIPGKCKPILWEELSWTDIEQITKTFKMGVLPIGTSEQYGPHLLRGVDTIHCMR